MKPSLQLRLSQHLTLTPQLQQSIRLLQLSTLELQQEVGQLLDENPFLELEDDTPATPYETPPERQSADRPAEADAEPAEGVPELGAEEFGTALRDDWENGTEGDDFDGIRELPSASAAAGDGDDDGEAHDRRAAAGSLQDHLRAQLVGLRLQPEDLAAVEVLIESLDVDGYLADPLEEVAERLAAMLGLDDPEAREQLADRLRVGLCMLQSLDPPGVGARSLPECLKLQLKAMPRCAARQVALRIAEQYLEPLARRDYRRLAALTGSHEDTVREAHELIRRCEPKPGRPFTAAEANVIVPDVIVRKTGRGLAVTLNSDVMPRLRINDLYAQAAKLSLIHI